jgi:hypothetical protein
MQMAGGYDDRALRPAGVRFTGFDLTTQSTVREVVRYVGQDANAPLPIQQLPGRSRGSGVMYEDLR